MSLQSLAYMFRYRNISSYSTDSHTVDTAEYKTCLALITQYLFWHILTNYGLLYTSSHIHSYFNYTSA